MLVGVKFCGGCNPRYDRGKALETMKTQLLGKAEFVIAEEGIEYDFLLVIGGCTNCCASHNQYKAGKETIKIWDENHIDKTIQKFEKWEE